MSPASTQQSIGEILRSRAERHGARKAAIFLADGETVAGERTYGELDLAARRIAAWLEERTRPGDRVLLVLPAGLEVIEAFFGCLYAGTTAVLTYPPRRRGNLAQLGRIARDSGAGIVLSRSDMLDGLGAADGFGGRADCQVQAVDRLPAGESAWRPVADDPTGLAFLQYTSGSTGAPKGVEVTQANVIANQQAIERIFRQRPESMVMAGWLPLYHDMGLVGNLLHPLYLGGTLVFMPPLAFLQRPARWLQMITRYRATISGGPNFAYDLCSSRITEAERATLDLRSWEVAFNGAEPVRAASLDRFQEAFRPAGFAPAAFCPCYGMAETTLLVSGSLPGTPWKAVEADAGALGNHRLAPAPPGCPDTVRLVSSGGVDEAFAARIVDPATAAPLPDGEVGEIWISGPSVARGYWGNEQATAERFGRRVADPDDDRGYLRTGDLGAVLDGELYVTGRLKDLIIIHGVNHYPQDLEFRAESAHPDLTPGSCVAFGTAGGDTERLTIACEVARGAWRAFDLDAIVAAVCAAIWEEHQLAVDRFLLVRPGGLPKTTSGKLQRALTGRMAADGSLPVLASWERPRSEPVPPAAVPSPAAHPEADEIRGWLRDRVARLTGMAPDRVSVHQPFAMTGLTSIAMVQLAAELGDKLGRHVPATLAYDHPTIDSLSRAVVAQADGAAAAPLLPETACADEPIAVISLAGRFPGAESPAALWRLLREGRSAIGPPPAGRAGTDAWRLVPPAGYLAEIDRFDPLFFGISPREADEIDPQHRLIMEVTWEALENAGLTLPRAAAARTGVFIGAGGGDYARLMARSGHEAAGHLAVGNAAAMAANRISYLFNFRGPSLTIDTACSSSLVAVHYAAESLRRGECDLAVAGGTNVICGPDLSAALAQAGMLSPGGTSRAFAAGADGYVRGEGCGIVLLKRLADARRDGDPVVAVLRGTAVNQDGRSNGLTAPNGLAQQAVIKTALARSRLEPGDIDAIEAHGTSTELGDPIEMHALLAVFGPRAGPLRVASLKNNIGHLEAAAGIAGLIKVCLALEHGTLPPHLHADRPSKQIAWQPGFELPDRSLSWSAQRGRLRRAGVSSFGFGGTNAHVVVEEPPEPAVAPRPPIGGWLPLSAKSPAALRDLAARYADALTAGDLAERDLAEVVAAAALGRTELGCRAAFPAESRAGLVDRLRRFASAPAEPAESDSGGAGGCRGDWARGDSLEPPRWVWSFPDPSAFAAADAAAELARAFPRFAEIHDRLLARAEAAAGGGGRAIAFQCGLAEWWRLIGIQPAGIEAQGRGGFAAAVTAGLLSIEEAVRLEDRGAAPPSLPEQAPGLESAPRLVVADLRARPAGCPALAAVGSPSRGVEEFWATVARGFCAGSSLDWELLFGGRVRVDGLPNYPFERQSCWFRREPAAVAADSLLGRRLDVAGMTAVYETDLGRCPELADHRVRGAAVLPTAAYCVLATAVVEAAGCGPVVIEDLVIDAALTWRPEAATRVQIALVPAAREQAGRGPWRCEISVRRESGWQRCGTCRLVPAEQAASSRLAAGSAPAFWQPTGAAVDVATHYSRCAAAGLGYDGLFRCLEAVHAAPREAWAEVSLAAAKRSHGAVPDAVLRTALLDGCLQSIAAIGDLPAGLHLPVSVAKFRLDPAVEARAMRVHARLVDGDERAAVICEVTLFDGDGSPCGLIEGLRLKSASPEAPAPAAPPSEIHWAESWELEARTGAGDGPPLLSASLLATVLRGHSAEPRAAAAIDTDSRRCLAAVAAAFAGNALCDLLAHPPAGTVVLEQEACDRAGVVAAKRPLFRRLLEIVAAEGWLRPAAGGWVVEPGLVERDAVAAGREALAAEPALAPELRLAMRCGPHVAAVLRGDEDPLGLLFGGRGSSLAADVYALSAGAKTLNELAARAVAELAAALPTGRRLRVLEVGGGTAATTRAILAAVPAWKIDYTFTDVGQAFLAAAAEEFSDLPSFAARRLDIERAPAAQGFEPAGWDVVVAVNVLHATSDLRECVSHVHSLLAPGGQLLLVEGTHPVAWMDLTFGLTDGWWRCRERDDFRDYPLVEPDCWRACLERAGCGEFATVAPGRDPAASAENVLCIATADRPAGEPAPGAESECLNEVLILGLEGSAGHALEAAFARHGRRARLLEVPRRPTAEWSRALAASLRGGESAEVVVLSAAAAGLEHEGRSLPDAAAELIDAVRVVLQSLLGAGGGPAAVSLVTSGAHRLPGDRAVCPAQAALHAVFRTLALERPECLVRLLDLSGDEPLDAALVVAELAHEQPHREVAVRGDRRLVRRLRPQAIAAGGPANRRLAIRHRGGSDGLQLVTEPRRPVGPAEVEIAVEAAGLNFRDLLNLLGRYPEEVPLGAECAGVVTGVGSAVTGRRVGERVLAVAADCLASFATAPAAVVLPLPDELDGITAASLPVAFLTAAVALDSLAGLRPGQRVLVHAATGGVGLAAVALANARGAAIFATAGTGKHAQLLARGVTDVFDSRTTGFAAAIRGRTADAGVDVVLNTLAESFVGENLAALATGGIYVDITKPTADVAARVARERPDVRYCRFDLAALLRADPEPLRDRLAGLVGDVARGRLPRLPTRSYPLAEHACAFRMLERAEHVGKLVLQPEPVPAAVAGARPVAVRADGAYLITGGTGDLGLLTARLLAEQGAGLVVLVARRPPDRRQQAAIEELRVAGHRLEVAVADVADRRRLAEVLEEVRRRMPIAGVVHAAGVLADGLLEEQSPESFAAVLAPKVRGGWNLHELTRDDPLDLFVLYASLAGVLGAPGQANHAAASGFLAGLADHRLASGRPVTCLEFGPWAEIGAAARRDVGQRADLRGIGMLSVAAGTLALRQALGISDVRYAVAPLAPAELPGRLRSAGLFGGGPASGPEAAREANLRGAFAAVPAEQVEAWVQDRVAETLARILGIGDRGSIRPLAPLVDLGLDSLTSIEFIDSLNRDWAATWPASTVYDHPSVAALARFIVARIRPAASGPPPSAPAEEPVLTTEPALKTELDDEDAAELDGELAHLLVELDRWQN